MGRTPIEEFKDSISPDGGGDKRLDTAIGKELPSLVFNLDMRPPIFSVLHWATLSHLAGLGRLTESEVRIKFVCLLISSSRQIKTLNCPPRWAATDGPGLGASEDSTGTSGDPLPQAGTESVPQGSPIVIKHSS